MAIVSCQGCGVMSDSKLCCPRCNELGRASFFHSQECFRENWAAHNKLHEVIRKVQMSKIVVPITVSGKVSDEDSLDTENSLHGVRISATTDEGSSSASYFTSRNGHTMASLQQRKPLTSFLGSGMLHNEFGRQTMDYAPQTPNHLGTALQNVAGTPPTAAHEQPSSLVGAPSLSMLSSVEWWKFVIQRRITHLCKFIKSMSVFEQLRNRTSYFPQSITSIKRGTLCIQENITRPWIVVILICLAITIIAYYTGRNTHRIFIGYSQKNSHDMQADAQTSSNDNGGMLSSELKRIVRSNEEDIRVLKSAVQQLQEQLREVNRVNQTDHGGAKHDTPSKQIEGIPHLHDIKMQTQNATIEKELDGNEIGAVKERNIDAKIVAKSDVEDSGQHDVNVVKNSEDAGQSNSKFRKPRQQQEGGQLV